MRKFILPILVFLAIGSILIFPDLINRKESGNNVEKIRIALFRFNSNQLQEETEKGVLSVIEASKEFKDGNIEIKRFCSEGDLPTANTIAMNIVDEKFDMVVTISTPALQVMANANTKGTVTHVFCAVTDPIASGVGITGTNASEHPPHLVGVGTFQPVESVIRIAKEMNPRLKNLGVVWCVGETCSEACVKKARVICSQIGIKLMEKSVESVSQVYEAALSLCENNADALWIGGDNVVESAIEMYVGAASKHRIPVFTNNPKHALKGAMANLGANYFEVGATAGNMAMSLIHGLPTNKVEIKNIVPELLYINDSVRKLMKADWIFPKELLEKADSVIR